MNPWLKIPSSEYEGHMSAPGVEQLQVLNNIFKNIIDEFPAGSICVMGCTNGNGFEHFVGLNCRMILGIDINYSYLNECRAWFVEDLPSMNLICADLDTIELKDNSFDLIHAALVLEYINVENVVKKMSRWLKPNGILTVVLQLPSDESLPVSETEFESLKLLSPILKLVDVECLVNITAQNNLKLIRSFTINLKREKKFYIGHLKKFF
ncbi:MAG: class I SAM-dependent methyltransferase [Bacteroidota bacterium]